MIRFEKYRKFKFNLLSDLIANKDLARSEIFEICKFLLGLFNLFVPET